MADVGRCKASRRLLPGNEIENYKNKALGHNMADLLKSLKIKLKIKFFHPIGLMHISHNTDKLLRSSPPNHNRNINQMFKLQYHNRNPNKFRSPNLHSTSFHCGVGRSVYTYAAYACQGIIAYKCQYCPPMFGMC